MLNAIFQITARILFLLNNDILNNINIFKEKLVKFNILKSIAFKIIQ